jgi:Fe-S cluster assembly protein SufD
MPTTTPPTDTEHNQDINTMITTSEETQTPHAALQNIDPSAIDQGPDWFRASRHAAIETFRRLGLPDTRHEEWRFTNIAPIRQTAFTLPDSSPNTSREDINPLRIPDLDCFRIVFVNGRYSPRLSDTHGLPPGLEVWNLAEAFTAKQSLLQTHLGRYADAANQPFTAWNTALASDGAVIFVPKGTPVPKPIHLLHVTLSTDHPIVVSPRHLIVTEADANLTVIEDYASTHNSTYLTNAVTEIVVGPNSDVTHYLIERESPQAYCITTLHVQQARDSRFTSNSLQFGGQIVRNNVNPVLNGPNAHSTLNGLYVPTADQTIDNHMRVVHAMPHCDSRQFYKGIMTERSRGVFRGRIIVKQDAQKTDAKQSNQNLLLSDHATANTDPQLEIYADDVKCTHGATVGQINQDQVFYLRSRGIPLQTARAMIIYAFASEGLERMSLPPIRRLARSMLLSRLPDGKLLEQSL